MKIAIIDADLIGRSKHRFPNLVCMKLSGYYKELGNEVVLKTDYGNLLVYDKVFISKVFSDTPIDEEILNLSNVEYGGTGFFYDKAPKLSEEIEHHMPDYHLYDEWVNSKLSEVKQVKDKSGNIKSIPKYDRKDFAYYLDYSIGFMTRGCIRQCSFCVNKNYKSCMVHSKLSEFLEAERPYICLLDDNVLACQHWKMVFDELIASGKKFQFKQGLDERLLTEDKCDYIFRKANWIGDRIFAFDNIKDREIIEKKLQMIRRYTNMKVKFYVFCGYNHENAGAYNEEFWLKDISDLFERIKILMEYGCLPYVMRYKDYDLSPYRGIYIEAASWCNQPGLFTKMSFEEFCKAKGMGCKGLKKYKFDFASYLSDGGCKGAPWRYYEDFSERYPDIAEKYFHMKWNYANCDRSEK